MSHDFLGFLTLHYDDLRAFVRAVLRRTKATSDFLHRVAPRLQKAWPSAAPPGGHLAWARACLARELCDPEQPLRSASCLAALAEAFARRLDPRADRGSRLDAAIQALSQDAQPVLTARYEGDLPLETLAWRFRTSAEQAFGALVRIRRLLLQALHGRIPHALCRIHELGQRTMESTSSLAEEQELAEAVVREREASDLVADAGRLDADLAAYFTQDVDAPDEGVSLALKLAARKP
jgi:hypothetical protein